MLSHINGADPTEFDASMNIEAGETSMSFSLQYSNVWMTEDAAMGVLRSFQQAVISLVGGDNLRLEQVDVISREEIQQLREWNSTIRMAMDTCVHELVHEQYLRDPNAPAVSAWDGNLTYGELDDVAERLAHHLVTLGVGPESVVALCFEKSCWAIVSMVAVLKAGGAYVSLIPSLPQVRMQSMIATVQPYIMLTNVSSPPHDNGSYIKHTIAVDAAFALSLPHVSLPLDAPCSSRNAALITFTSGSTGTPKAAVLTHSSLATMAKAQGPHMRIGPLSRVFQFASYSFDVSNSEIFTTLMNGGCVCVPSEGQRINDLPGTVQAMGVTWMFLTPTVARLLDFGVLPSVKTLALGGEAIEQELVDRWADSVYLINSYGPSENSIWTSTSHLEAGNPANNIGFGIECTTWVVDASDYNRLCPIGVAGELLIEGPLLARGYLNDAEKTAAAFIKDPAWIWRHNLNLGSGRRMYRTGDLVRQNSDGSLTYIGRRDTQIKINGQRVEMGDIEHWVKKLLPEASIVAADLVLPAGQNRSPIIAVAIELQSAGDFQPQPSPMPLSSTLRGLFARLKSMLPEVLPSYMIPSLYIPVTQLPITTTGKLDRRLIRQMVERIDEGQLSQYSLSDDIAAVAPSTAMERSLQVIWSDILGLAVDQVGANNHFFRSGGDSVAAMRLVAMARVAQIALTVADVFQYPKLSDMAASLAERSQSREEGEEAANDIAPFALWDAESPIVQALPRLAAQCNVPTDQIEDVYPCTPLQEGLLTLSSQEPRRYVGRRIFRITKELDVQRFKAAWEHLVELTPILRTRIVLGGDQTQALQVVIREPIYWLEEESDLDAFLAADLTKPMGNGSPLVRYAIIRGRNDLNKIYFVWTSHHSIYDGWSASRLFENLTKIYTGKLQEVPQTIPFTRFIQHLQQEDEEATRSYWQSQVQGGDASTRFPALPQQLYQPHASQKVSRQLILAPWIAPSAVTLAILLRAAWALVISQYTGSNNVAFGVPLSGRTAPVNGILDIIAPTMTTVPVHVHINRSQTAWDYIAAVQEQAVSMMPFEHTGLQRIRELVGGAAADVHHLLVVQPATERDDHLGKGFPGLETLPVEVDGFDGYGLTVECNTDMEEDGTIGLEARFDDKIVPIEQAERLLLHLEHVVRQLQIVAMSEAGENNIQVGDIEVVTPEEVQQLQMWNEATPPAIGSCIHDLVYEQYLRQPHALAVCAWDGDLTYEELEDLSQRLARHLIGLGVGPEKMVPVCFEKSRWAVVSMLAVLKAGGVVVPIGTQHPIQRVRITLENTKTTVMLADAQHAGKFESILSQVLTVNETLLDRLSIGPVCETVGSSNAAFVIFTSGSTGTPKGIVLEHQALCTTMQAQGKAFNVGPQTRTLQFSAYTFDVSISDIFTTLFYGGCVCVISEDDRMGDLVGAMNATEVNLAILTSTVAGLLDPGTTPVPSMKTLALMGEPVNSEVVTAWTPYATVFNTYGPAECSILCTCSQPLGHGVETANIGFALSGRLWVVNPLDYNQLCPIGVAGELLVEGPLLARGYLNNLDKTAASFITDPKWVRRYNLGSNRRFYCTGDLVRQNADGSFTSLGRRDTQIKINGQRVETGEIEYWTKNLFPMASAAAAAFITPARQARKPVLAIALEVHPNGIESQPPTSTSTMIPMSDDLRKRLLRLQDSLFDVLPSYMVPSLYVPMSQLPLSSSGKLDRLLICQTLEAMNEEQLLQYSFSNVELVAPSTATERSLQALWVTILGIAANQVGASTHFFRSGGDSVAAMRLVAMARDAQIALTVADIFKHPRLSDMANLADQSHSQEEATVDVGPFALWKADMSSAHTRSQALSRLATQCGVAMDDIEDVYPCTSLQEGLLTISTTQESRRYVGRRIFRITKDINVPRFKAAWEQLAELTPVLRTRIVLDHTEALQVVIREPISWLEASDLDAYLAADLATPMKFSSSLVRYAIIPGGAESDDDYFVWTVHHSLYDGWSIGLLFESVAAIYNCQPIPPRVPFTRFIRHLEQVDKEASLSYWHSQLQGDVATANFPALPGPRYQPRPLRRCYRQMALGASTPLSTRAAVAPATLATVLRAAWALVVSKHVGSDDIIFAAPLSGRTVPVPGVLDIVAPTITTVPVRIRIDRTKTVHEYLSAVQQQAVEMMAFEHTGLQHIRRLVGTDPGSATVDAKDNFILGNATSTPINIFGKGGPLNGTEPPYKPEDIVILTDGSCSSTCTIFINHMIPYGVRVVANGGRPQMGPMQGIGGVKGSQVQELSTISLLYRAANEVVQNATASGKPRLPGSQSSRKRN